MPRILIIEDDDSLRYMLRLSLEVTGHTVAEARDGKEGLKLYAREPAELVITDLIMPEKEGIETIIELRKKNPGLKIIAISGGGGKPAENYLKIAKRVGAGFVLPKPFSTDELQSAVNGMLAGAA